MRYIGLLLVAVLLLPCCGRVKPQGAANRQEPDSTAMLLMQKHFLMALDADRLLVDSVRHASVPYVLDRNNFWYCRLTKTDGPEVMKQMRVEYTAIVRDLATGALIEEITEEVEVGKRQTLRAIDICLPLMREGETFRILAPYYNAYGLDGNDHVPPQTNVSILLTVNSIN